jgi:hypothetical protein
MSSLRRGKMLYSITRCMERVYLPTPERARVIKEALESERLMNWISEQIFLTRMIAKHYWRPLTNPDIFYDGDLMCPVAWTEAGAGTKRPDPMTYWPLWTMDDCFNWISANGHQFISCYSYPSPERYETYFTYGEHKKLAKITAGSLLTVLLQFIDNCLKGDYEEKEKK